MVTDTGREGEELRARRRATQIEQPERESRGNTEGSEVSVLERSPGFGSSGYSSALLSDSRLGGRGNAPIRSSVMRSMQNTHGNRAVQRAVQRARQGGSGFGLSQPENDEYLAQRIESQSGSGSKLPVGVQAQLEDGLGADLSGVRVHTSSQADELARSMGAVAFTTGQDIFFRGGAYNPGAAEGLRLLTHETTHTVQQAAGPVEGVPSEGGVSISDPSDQFEQEAERSADVIMSGGQSDVSRGSSASSSTAAASVQRYAEPAPWIGQGQRHSDWNGMPTGPNIGMEPYNPGSAWTGGGGGSAWTGGGGGSWGSGGGYNPAFPGGGPFYNPTPDVPLPFHPMPSGGSGFGWDMPGKGQEPGPYAYYKGNGKTGTDFGVEAGVGAFHGEGNVLGMPVTDDLLYAKGQLGSWDDGQGGSRTGFNANAGVANWSINQGGFVSGQAEALTATAEASVGDSGATLGAQATAVGGSMTFGGDPTNKSDHDESVRLGLSEGVGLAGRLHWGDKDKDGHREYGVGADFGPFSFDIKSEDPVRTLARAAAGPLADYALGAGNATVPVEQFAGETWDTAKKYADQVGESAVNAYDTVSSEASGAYDTLSSAAGSAYDTVAGGMGGAYDAASSTASSAWDWLNS